MRDLTNCINPRPVIAPAAAKTDNTPWVGTVIDKRGFDSLTYVITTGDLADADATFAVLLEESNDPAMAGATAVADVDLIGTEALAGFTFAGDNKSFKLGYIGNYRYTRLTVTPSANAGNAFLSANAILGHADMEPTANPPV
jgi:hypothetical protein